MKQHTARDKSRISQAVAQMQSCFPQSQTGSEAKFYLRMAVEALARSTVEAVEKAVHDICTGHDGRPTKKYLPSTAELVQEAERAAEEISAERRRRGEMPMPGFWGYSDYLTAAAKNVLWGCRMVEDAAREVHERCPDYPAEQIAAELKEKVNEQCRRSGRPLKFRQAGAVSEATFSETGHLLASMPDGPLKRAGWRLWEAQKERAKALRAAGQS